MFYLEEIDPMLRFGDVLKGFVFASSSVKEPLLEISNGEYNINVSYPSFSVVMSPCCSIEKKMIALTPLIPILPSFLDNPYFEMDLTNINRRMQPEQSVSPARWESFGEEERQRRLAEGYGFAVTDLFVFKENDLLPNYTLNHPTRGKIDMGYYMIDFKNICKIYCDTIKGNKPLQAPLGSKCLQLSIETRGELREKISDYFGRIPKEDKIMEED